MSMLKHKDIFEMRDIRPDAAVRIRGCEPLAGPDGYAPGFSGGKDRAVILKSYKLTETKLTTHHPLTTIDPPEAVDFVRQVPEATIANRPGCLFRPMSPIRQRIADVERYPKHAAAFRKTFCRLQEQRMATAPDSVKRLPDGNAMFDWRITEKSAPAADGGLFA